MIEINNVVKCYGDDTVLNRATFQIEEGKLTTILGPSGCGKSTLLRCMNRLETFERGSMEICGVKIQGTEDHQLGASEEKELTRRLRKQIGLVFQSFNLFPHLTALRNVSEAPLTVKRLSARAAEDLARHYLNKVGLFAQKGSYPAQLSGGQQQRVAIARTLAMEPDVILFDEPTSALDPQLIRDVAHLFCTLGDLGKTLIVVSHDLNFARRISDRLIYFEGGQAIEEGTPDELFENPRQPETCAFIRSFLWDDQQSIDKENGLVALRG